MHVGVVVFSTFTVTLVFLLALRPVASAVGLVDFPGGRKTHDVPVPLIGGICMSVGLGAGVVLLDTANVWSPMLLALYLLVVVGAIDDRFDLPPNVRLVAQICAALLIIYGMGTRITSLGSPLFFTAPLGVLSVPFTLLFIMTLINAFNFADGIDGSAGGLALIALISMAILGVGADVLPLILLLIGAVAAFLVCNLPLRLVQPIRAFMGDAGSTFVGLSVAIVGILWSQGVDTNRSPVVGLWLVAVPVFDLFCAIIRRVGAGRSPLAADHGHVHHVLIARGLSRGATLVLILGVAAACAAIGISGAMLRVPDGIMLIAWIAAGTACYRVLRRPVVALDMIFLGGLPGGPSKVQSAPP